MRFITLVLSLCSLIVLTSFKGIKSLTVASPAFAANGSIPVKYTCLGQECNPPLQIGNIPEGTKSLAIILDDPDAKVKPQAKPVAVKKGRAVKAIHAKKMTVAAAPASEGCFTHWLIWNIEATDNVIPENYRSDYIGLNSINQQAYKGMCPSEGAHHYHFKVYALDTKLNISARSDRKAIEKVMQGHILATGELVGIFDKNYR